MEGKINVRYYSLNKRKLETSVNHNFRVRKTLTNVDYSKGADNFYSHSPSQFRELAAQVKEEHAALYNKLYKRNPQESKVNALTEGVITFPRIYQTYLEEGRFSKADLRRYFSKFKEIYEAESNTRIIGEVWHFDEDTFHMHWYATNYEVTGKNAGKHFNPKGWGSYTQDIAGEAFKEIGLRRGDPKSVTRAKHSTQHEHYQKTLDDSSKIEAMGKSGELNLEAVEELIKHLDKPLKTMMTYVKRSMDKAKEAEYIIQQQTRAMSKFREVFPNIEDINDFMDLLNYIKQKPKGIDWEAVEQERKNAKRPR